MKIINCIKDHIRLSRVYQKKKSSDYYKDRNNAVMRYTMSNDEMGDKRKVLFFQGSKAEQLVEMMKNTNIVIKSGKRFQSWIDTGLYVSHPFSMLDNTAPNYSVILNQSLEELSNVYIGKDDGYSKELGMLLNGIKEYILRITKKIDSSIANCENIIDCHQLMRTKEYFSNMLNSCAKSLEEGLQRILFWSSVFWQSQHSLMGLGRLDKILSDLECPSDEETVEILKDFYQELHRYYAFKSKWRMMGDTGQIIIIGGVEPNGTYFSNKLTYLIICALKSNPIPDPKILLRVSDKMPDDLLQLAVQCIASGAGCPLLSNDDVIVPALEDFGYSHADACNYVTSACWEPLAYGKSLEKNNINCINYAQVIVDTYEDKSFENSTDFDSVLSLFFKKLEIQMKSILANLTYINWEPDPLLSLFIKNCDVKKLDISQGGAVYNNYGILSVGMANAVNSLLNIKQLVFVEQKYSLRDIKKACISNFSMQYADMQSDMLSHTYFGKDDVYSIELTRRITDYTNFLCLNWKNPFGGILKWGLSAPNYVESGNAVSATMDGRMKGKPLAVHISASEGAYTELINFACKLNYSGQRSNGNVVDFFITPEFIQNNFNKFLSFIKVSIREGFFQLQMNVVSSKTLIAAKENPELYPKLIVRVWGFSAYFNDLPEEYKNVLIARATESEKSMIV